MKKQFQDRGFGGPDSREFKDLVRSEMIHLHKTLRAKNNKVFSHAQTASDVNVYSEDQPMIFKNPRELINLKIDGVALVK